MSRPDPMNEMILAADRVAARRAAAVARQYGTTLSVVQNGKLIELTPDEFERCLDEEEAGKKID